MPFVVPIRILLGRLKPLTESVVPSSPVFVEAIFSARACSRSQEAYDGRVVVPRHLRLSLSILQLASFATLVRSIAFDRWITVVASIGLLVGAYAAQRGRTWGVALSFAMGMTFIGVSALGIAPTWFALVGLLAMRPFARLFGHFLRFDRGAAVTLAVLAAGAGGLGAVAWKEYALDLFRALPALLPSAAPHHGLAIVAVLAAAVVGRRFLSAPAEKIGTETAALTSSAAIEDVHLRVSSATVTREDAAALDEVESDFGGAPTSRRSAST